LSADLAIFFFVIFLQSYEDEISFMGIVIRI